MLFDSLTFWVFFLLTLVLVALTTGAYRKAVLVGLSFVFYGFWDVRFLLLLGGSVAVNYGLGLLGGRGKRGVVTLAIVCNLLLLGFFKYYNFFAASLAYVLHLAPQSVMLNIILPVGISFFTFEGIAYAIDLYRGDLRPIRQPLNFALFMSFFPHLVAGPIIRPGDFFPQMAASEELDRADVRWGCKEILKGLIKKVLLADSLGLIADAYFGTDHHGPTVPAIVGVLAFSFQIYFDFSGYTDIARGCARLLGYRFPPNFERPYLSPNIAQFWRRWHISLSSWLRDYLYFSLGGNRSGAWRTNVNLLTVMVLGGLWHGASWTFAIWGAYHGVLLIVHRLWRLGLEQLPRVEAFFRSAALVPVWVVITFAAATLGWIPFRAQGLVPMQQTLLELRATWMHWPALIPPSFWLLAGVCSTFCWLDRGRRWQNWLVERASGVAFAAFGGLALFALEVLAHTELRPAFIYFQF